MIAVREGHLDVLGLEVNNWIERFAGEFLREQIHQSVLGAERLAVEGQREAAVQERVVPQHILDELFAEPKILPEERLVRRELNERAVPLVRLRDLVVLLQLARAKLDELGLTLAKSLRAIIDRERV